MSDELAEAERHLRRASHYRWPSDDRDYWKVYSTEFDRLRLVEQAATALVERWDDGDFRVGPVGNALLDALATAVRRETP